MKIMFICNQGKHRSKTAELLFKESYETRSRGLFGLPPLKENDLNWADIIIVMEDFQREEISKRFPSQYLKKRILCLNIPDIFQFQQPELINLLREKIKNSLAPFSKLN